ncbi:DUF5719 family protein [Tessaracoccus antarcticus]|uniref:Uncharacterized protein n=1 Tax=Tessaracoccus antarcticus TaxID=2479848 RepID=A0A3M0GM71_9ACTN|nr:DUF5719 family protein [Tessaracoccus antarcticus]RMB62279.1 hypothetical protein EAX62_06905 [Tessaracoccus antarcticus]
MRNVITLVTLLVLVGAGLGLSLLRPTPLPRTIEVVPPATTKLVCAPMAQAGTLFVDGADTITPLGGDGIVAVGPTQVPDQSGASVILGGSALVGGMLTLGDGTGGWTPCTAPTSQGTIVVPGAADTDLLVVNPDSSEAVVDLSLYGTNGEIVALGARGIALGPHSTRAIALSVLVEQDGPIGVSFSASRGRATVVARTTTARGVLETATASTQGTDHWLPGVQAGATVASLLVTNPGNERAVVDVTAHGASVAYQPEGGAGVSVPAHSSIAVDLAPSLAGEATGLHVTADIDVAVSLSTGNGSDLAFTAPVTTSNRLGAYAPAGGVLQVSNPGETDLEVSLVDDVVDGRSTTTEHTVPAGSTLALPLESSAPRGQVVTITANRPLFGAVVGSDTGVSIVPLSSRAAPEVSPVDAEIVPTLR